MTRRTFPSRKPADWPARDRELWFAALSPCPFIDDPGVATQWSAATLRKCERGYGVWLGWLDSQGLLDSNPLPSSRVSGQRIAQLMNEYQLGRAPLTVAGLVRDIALTLKAMCPPRGIEWLSQMAFRMTNRAVPARPKLPRMAPITSILIADAGMEAALARFGDRPASGAIAYRDALVLAFLAYRPLRVRNLSGLRFGDDFLVDACGMRIEVGTAATKRGVPYDAQVPDDLLPRMERWIEEIRPTFIPPGTTDPGWLWLTRRGRRLTETQLATRLRKFAQAALGRALTPHLVRDCVATQIALSAPADVGITKDLLGHATLASSQKYYNQATSFSAFTAQNDVVAQFRAEALPGPTMLGDADE